MSELQFRIQKRNRFIYYYYAYISFLSNYGLHNQPIEIEKSFITFTFLKEFSLWHLLKENPTKNLNALALAINLNSKWLDSHFTSFYKGWTQKHGTYFQKILRVNGQYPNNSNQRTCKTPNKSSSLIICCSMNLWLNAWSTYYLDNFLQANFFDICSNCI